jgi:hypothetical protein
MALKKGNGLPKRGNGLPLLSTDGPYEQVVSTALRKELGGARHAAKTLVRWTGAGTRTAKHWLAGSAGPSGEHLIALMRNSNSVFEAVLVLAERRNYDLPHTSPDSGERLAELRTLLESALALTRESP